MKIYNKLVRDRIPEIIEAEGKRVTVRVLDEAEYRKALLEKSPRPELALIAQAGLAERGEDVDLGLADLTLGQGDPELKSLAVRVLAAARRPQALELLSKALRGDDSRRIRVEAAAAVIVRLRRVEAPGEGRPPR